MIGITILKDYLHHLEEGVKTLSSYNIGYKHVSLICFAGASFFVPVFFFAIYETLSRNDYNIDMIWALYKNNPELVNYAYYGIGCLLGFLFFKSFHHSRLRKQLKTYLEKNHLMITSRHKKIFRDHSEESLQAFVDCNDKSHLLVMLKTESERMKFVIENYDNFLCKENDD